MPSNCPRSVRKPGHARMSVSQRTDARRICAHAVAMRVRALEKKRKSPRLVLAWRWQKIARPGELAHRIGRRRRDRSDLRHGSGGSLGLRFWRPFQPDQLGPDGMPCGLAQGPAHQFAARFGFDAPRLRRTHVAAPCKALVQVLLIDAVDISEAAPLLRCDRAHRPSV